LSKPKLQCPECSNKYATVQLLAMHRARAHNVAGSSKSHLAALAKKARQEAKPTLKCPDCSFAAETTQALIWHRTKAHDYVGHTPHRGSPSTSPKKLGRPSNSARTCGSCGFIAANKAGLTWHIKSTHPEIILPPHEEPKETPFACPDCDRSFGSEMGLNRHRRTHAQGGNIEVHSLATRTAQNGRLTHGQEADAHGGSIPEAAIAFAAGRVQELLTRYAAELDVAPRTFASRVLILVSHAS
jgi:uncharacterized C2H2 Zn-finger protein